MQSSSVIICIKFENTVRMDIDGVQRYATPLLRDKNMPCLYAPKEAVLPQLRGIEKQLDKDRIWLQHTKRSWLN